MGYLLAVTAKTIPPRMIEIKEQIPISEIGHFRVIYLSFSLSFPKKPLKRCFFFFSMVEAPSVL